jgi:hypothetical protein
MTERQVAANARVTPRRLLELFGTAMALIGICLLAGLFTASEFYRRSIAMGATPAAIDVLVLFQVVSGLIWAVATPLIIAIAERLPLRKPFVIRNALLLAVIIPVIAVVRAVIGAAILNLGEGHHVSLDLIRFSVSIRTHRNIAIEVMIVVITNLVLAQREASTRARRDLAAKTLLARAELDGLRAQMQPHFLFLTLRTISDMVPVDAGAADDMIVGLADLLRRSLALGNDPVPLSDELDFVDRSLALYQVCFGGRLSVRYDADESVLGARVPPLLIQQLVEVAVMNGIAPTGGGEIEIRCRRAGELLRIEVLDRGTVNGRADEELLAPVRARLEKLFGAGHNVVQISEDDRVVTAVTIPLLGAERPAGIAFQAVARGAV